MMSAKLIFTIPDVNPLLAARNKESDDDILRVRLLSIAQHKHAAGLIS